MKSGASSWHLCKRKQKLLIWALWRASVERAPKREEMKLSSAVCGGGGSFSACKEQKCCCEQHQTPGAALQHRTSPPCPGMRAVVSGSRRCFLPSRAAAGQLTPRGGGPTYVLRPRVRWQCEGRQGRQIGAVSRVKVRHGLHRLCQCCFLLFFPSLGFNIFAPVGNDLCSVIRRARETRALTPSSCLVRSPELCFWHPRTHPLFVQPGSMLQLQRQHGRPSRSHLTA